MKKFLKKVLPPKAYYFLKRKRTKQFDERYLIYDFLNFKNGVMFDVGVMDGSSFMPFLLKGWDVYAFEPDNSNHKLVSEYLKKWNLKTNLLKKAVSDVEETKTFYTSTLSSGIPSLLKFNNNQVASHEVSTIMLKSFIKTNNIDKIDFIKTDCEGGEYALISNENIGWIKKNVRNIVGEWHLDQIEDKVEFRYFRDKFLSQFKNYEIYSVDGHDVKWDIPNEHFINYYNQVIIHIEV